jgi:hypothetical protein
MEAQMSKEQNPASGCTGQSDCYVPELVEWCGAAMVAFGYSVKLHLGGKSHLLPLSLAEQIRDELDYILKHNASLSLPRDERG